MASSGNSSIESNPTLLSLFFDNYLQDIHSPLVCSLCIFGIIANSVNVVVLTRPLLRSNPINILLCGLSASQTLLLISYFLYNVYERFLDGDCAFRFKTHAWLLYLIINVNSNLVFHTSAMIFTCLLALFRYLIIHFPQRHYINIRRARNAVIFTFIGVPMLCFSLLANSNIAVVTRLGENCENSPNFTIYQLRYRNYELQIFNFLFFSIVCKLIPVTAMIVLNGLLVLDLHIAAKRHKMLRKNDKTRRRSQNYRVTVLLLTIVCLLVAVELPKCILNTIHAMYKLGMAFQGSEFTQRIYMKIGALLEMLTVLYSSINFVVICTMSQQFRDQFHSTFFPRCLISIPPKAPNANNEECTNDGDDLETMAPTTAAARTLNGGVLRRVGSDSSAQQFDETQSLRISVSTNRTAEMAEEGDDMHVSLL